MGPVRLVSGQDLLVLVRGRQLVLGGVVVTIVKAEALGSDVSSG